MAARPRQVPSRARVCQGRIRGSTNRTDRRRRFFLFKYLSRNKYNVVFPMDGYPISSYEPCPMLNDDATSTGAYHVTVHDRQPSKTTYLPTYVPKYLQAETKKDQNAAARHRTPHHRRPRRLLRRSTALDRGRGDSSRSECRRATSITGLRHQHILSHLPTHTTHPIARVRPPTKERYLQAASPSPQRARGTPMSKNPHEPLEAKTPKTTIPTLLESRQKQERTLTIGTSASFFTRPQPSCSLSPNTPKQSRNIAPQVRLYRTRPVVSLRAQHTPKSKWANR